MPTIIYRTRDRLYAGVVYPPHSVPVELDNIVNSALGGLVGDYSTVDVATFPAGRRPVIAPNGRVTFEEMPDIVARRGDKSRAEGKLIALGLTAREIDALADRSEA